MEKVTSKFLFKNKYQDEKDLQEVTIILDIDYQAKNYTITPFGGNVKYGFTFIQTSHKWKMWKAVTQSINDAIDFANKELNSASPSPD